MSPGWAPYAGRMYDAVVVGAGPAGSASAALLAGQGLDVLVVERARFPRPKPCAEYLSPEAGRVLDRLGVLDAILQERPARLRGMRVISPDGTAFTGRFAALHGYVPYTAHGLALPRELLDAHIARAARRAGATILEGTRLETIERSAHGPIRIRVRAGGARFPLRARLLIGADGLNSRVARWLAVTRRGRPRRIAFVTHMDGVRDMGDVGEMHVVRGAYLGLARVGADRTNVAIVADAAVLPGGDTEQRFANLLRRFPGVAPRLRAAQRVGPVRAVGPFAHRTTRATGDRVLLVGDAADFYDPFTGEGIYAALRGAELAAGRAAQALAADRLRARDLAPYDRDRRRAFAGKWVVERLVAAAVASPALLNHVARRLRARRSLADLLVGVTGDFIPPSRVLRPTFAWGILR